MQEKKINFDDVEMLMNLRADINQTILTTTLNAASTTTKEENANDIQANINKIIATYIDYVLTK